VNSDVVIKAKLDDILDGDPRVAWAALAVNKGRIVYERYLSGGKENAYPGWSISKSVTSLSFGYALCEGKIKSIDDRADQYVSFLKNTPWGEAKLKNLLTMSSGASRTNLNLASGDYTVGSTPFSYSIARNKLRINQVFSRAGNDADRRDPGSNFVYNNLDTEAIGAVISSAVGQSFQDYFSSVIWPQIDAEHKAYWLLDSDKQAITHGFFFASLRDFGRIAQHLIDLYKRRVGSKCLQEYVREAFSPQLHVEGSVWYGFQFWIPGPKGFIAEMWGHQGQMILLNYEREKIIVLTAYRSNIFKKYRDPSNLYPWLRIP